MESKTLFGIRVDPISMRDTIAWVAKSIKSKTSSKIIVVVNAAKVIKARKDLRLKRAIESADLVPPDGVPIVWASRLLGNPLPGQVAGIDLMFALFAEGNRQSWSVFLLGANEEVIQKVGDIVRIRYPNMRIAGLRNGYFSAEEEPKIVRAIARTRANILFLGFGTPEKEYFAGRWKEELRVNVIHGVGGAFDILAGKTMRAPVWMQRAGLEWFFRLLQEPRRMFWRYLTTNTAFLLLLCKEIVTSYLVRRLPGMSSRGSADKR